MASIPPSGSATGEVCAGWGRMSRQITPSRPMRSTKPDSVLPFGPRPVRRGHLGHKSFDPDPTTGHDDTISSQRASEVLAGVLANAAADLSAH